MHESRAEGVSALNSGLARPAAACCLSRLFTAKEPITRTSDMREQNWLRVETCEWRLAEEGQIGRVALVRKVVGGVESLVVFGFGVERRASMEDAAEWKVRRSWSLSGVNRWMRPVENMSRALFYYGIWVVGESWVGGVGEEVVGTCRRRSIIVRTEP